MAEAEEDEAMEMAEPVEIDGDGGSQPNNPFCARLGRVLRKLYTSLSFAPFLPLFLYYASGWQHLELMVRAMAPAATDRSLGLNFLFLPLAASENRRGQQNFLKGALPVIWGN